MDDLTLFWVVTSTIQWRLLLATKTAQFCVIGMLHACCVCNSCTVYVAPTFFSWNYSDQKRVLQIKQRLYQFLDVSKWYYQNAGHMNYMCLSQNRIVWFRSNSIEPSFREIDSLSASWKIPCLLWNTKVYYRVHISCGPYSLSDKSNTYLTTLFKICFNISLQIISSN